MLTSQISDDYSTYNSSISSQISGVKKKERIYLEAVPEIYIHKLYYTCTCTQMNDGYLGIWPSLKILTESLIQ